jgi:hypothetical protein
MVPPPDIQTDPGARALITLAAGMNLAELRNEPRKNTEKDE